MSSISESSPGRSALYQRKLYLFGFLYCLFDCCLSNVVQGSEATEGEISIYPKTGGDLMGKIRQVFFGEGKLNRMPIVFIDECFFASRNHNANDITSNHYLRLIRKVFTSVGIVLVLLGTDSRITHLVETVGSESRNLQTAS